MGFPCIPIEADAMSMLVDAEQMSVLAKGNTAQKDTSGATGRAGRPKPRHGDSPPDLSLKITKSVHGSGIHSECLVRGRTLWHERYILVAIPA